MFEIRFGSAVNATVARVARATLLGHPIEGVFRVSRLYPLLPDGRGGWGLLADCRLRVPGEKPVRPEVLLEQCDAQIEEDYSGDVVTELGLVDGAGATR
jgi:hypothetical protein